MNRARGTTGLLGLALVVLASGCLRRPDDVKFPHEQHGKADVGCSTCHDSVYKTKRLTERHMPVMKTCFECHGENEKQCEMCHTDSKVAKKYPPKEFTILVSHELHNKITKEDCGACHKALPEIAKPGAPPPMDACLACHEHRKQFDDARCDVCHTDLVRYPLKPIGTFTHKADFLRQHGPAARAAGAACAQCHDQKFCADCHASTVAVMPELLYVERVERQFIHRGEFLGRHPVEARADQALCRRCHGQTFCDDCHTANALTSTAASPRSPHPAGYAVAGSGAHGADARRDIASCASCHDQGARSVCVTCHATGGPGGNPHPKSWLDRHDRAQIARDKMCLVCHR